MDPLSISASIAGLVTLADLVFRRSVSYVKAVKSSSKDLARLATELRLLAGVLNEVRLLITELEGKGDDIAIQSDQIKDCEQTLKDLKAKFPQLDSSILSTGKKLAKKLFSPFSASEIETLVGKLERFKSTFSLALGAKSVRKVIELLGGQELLLDEVRGLRQDLLSRQHLADQVALDEQKTKVVHFFRRVDPRQNHEMSLKLKFEGTGKWFENVQAYIEWQEGSSSGLWIYGIPGAGKTVLASSIIEHAISKCQDDDAIGYFYCDYKDGTKQDPINILGAIAVQLGLRSPAAFALLQDYYDKLHPSSHTENKPEVTELRQLIEKMFHVFTTTTIVIDGVDECLDSATIVISSFVTLAAACPERTRVAILSRDEHNIRTEIDRSNFGTVSIAAHKEDLMLYVAASMKERKDDGHLKVKSKELEDLILERLVDGAQGMFRWVACQLDHLCELPTDRSRRAALSKLPPTLDATYERILVQVSRQPQDTQAIIQRSLLWILYGGRMTAEQLCEAVSVHDDIENLDLEDRCDLDIILRHCRSLVRLSTDGRVESAHFTVLEFFAGPALEKHGLLRCFWLPRDVALRSIANTCLTYLTLKVFQGILPSSDDARTDFGLQYPFYSFATERWCGFNMSGKFLEADQTTLSLLRKLFHSSKTAAFTRWAYEIINPELIRRPTRRHHSISPLHLAAVLNLPLTVKWIINSQATTPDSSQYGTPLHWALLGNLNSAISMMNAFTLEQAYESMYEWYYVDDEILTMLLASAPDLNATFPISDLTAGPSIAEMLLFCGRTVGLAELKSRGHRFSAQVLGALKSEVKNGHTLYPNGILQLLGEDLFEPEAKPDLALLQLTLKQTSRKRRTNEYSDMNMEDLLSAAIREDQADIVEEILDMMPNAIDQLYPSGNSSALHLAALHGALKCLNHLLTITTPLDLVDDEGRLALHLSTSFSTACAELLLANDLDPSAQDGSGRNTYHMAAMHDNAALLKILLEHVESQRALSTTDNDGYTPLFSAALAGADNAFAMLLPISQTNSAALPMAQLTGIVAKNCSSRNLSSILEAFDAAEVCEELPRYILHDLCSNSKRTRASVAQLLDRGVPPFLLDSDRESGLHKLFHAVEPYDESREERKAIAQLLISEDLFKSIGNDGGNLVGLVLACDDYIYLQRERFLTDFINAGMDPMLVLQSIASDLITDEPHIHALTKKYDKQRVLDQVIGKVERVVMSDSVFQVAMFLLRKEDRRLITLLDKGLDPDWVDSKGQSLLEEAVCQVPNMIVFGGILAKSKRWTQRNNNGDFMTHILCAQSNAAQASAQLEALLDANIDPNAIGKFGATALVNAINHDHVELVRCLLDRGANPRLQGATSVDLWEDQQWYPIAWAAACGSVRSAAVLINHLPREDWSRDFTADLSYQMYTFQSRPLNVLQIATYYRRLGTVKLFLDEDIVGINDNNGDGETSLHLAVAASYMDIVSLLLERGADLGLPNKLGNTPLHLAAMKGNWQVAELLLKADSPQLLNKAGLDPRHEALVSNQKEFANKLTVWNSSHGVIPQSPSGTVTIIGSYRHGLSAAINSDDVEILGKLINGSAIEHALCECGCCSILVDALARGKLKVAGWALANGASPLDEHNCGTLSMAPQTYNAVHLAMWTKELTAALLDDLLEKSPPEIFLNGKSSPLHTAISHGNRIAFQKFLDHYAKPNIQRNQRLADKRSRDSISWIHELNGPVPYDGGTSISGTALHCAASLGDTTAVQLLLEHGANPNSAAPWTLLTPLQLATSNKHAMTVKLLLKHGANPFLQDDYGQDAYMTAYRSGAVEIVEILHRRGVDSSSRDFMGKPASFYARDSQCLAYLLDRRLVGTEERVSYVWDHVAIGAASFQRTMLCIHRHADLKEELFNPHVFSFDETAFFSRVLVHLSAAGRTSIRVQALIKFSIQTGGLETLGYLTRQTRLTLPSREDKLDLLFYACTIGRLKCLRFLALIQDWAPTMEESKSLYQAAKNFPEIREWLLVDRAWEQLRLEAGSGDDEVELRPWSGVWTVRVPLVGRYAKEAISDQSMVGFVIARQRIKKQHLMIYAAHLCKPWADFFEPKVVGVDSEAVGVDVQPVRVEVEAASEDSEAAR